MIMTAIKKIAKINIWHLSKTRQSTHHKKIILLIINHFILAILQNWKNRGRKSCWISKNIENHLNKLRENQKGLTKEKKIDRNKKRNHILKHVEIICLKKCKNMKDLMKKYGTTTTMTQKYIVNLDIAALIMGVIIKESLLSEAVTMRYLHINQDYMHLMGLIRIARYVSNQPLYKLKYTRKT